MESQYLSQHLISFPHLLTFQMYNFKKNKSSKYPVLASLARDYLSCCGSSAPAERTFSAAADVCASDRGSLSPWNIERLVGSRMWLRGGVKLEGKAWAELQAIADQAYGKFD